MDDAVRNIQRIDVSRDALRVICQRDRRASDHEYVGDHSAPSEALTEECEGSLKLGPAEQRCVCLGHAASRSWGVR